MVMEALLSEYQSLDEHLIAFLQLEADICNSCTLSVTIRTQLQMQTQQQQQQQQQQQVQEALQAINQSAVFVYHTVRILINHPIVHAALGVLAKSVADRAAKWAAELIKGSQDIRSVNVEIYGPDGKLIGSKDHKYKS